MDRNLAKYGSLLNFNFDSSSSNATINSSIVIVIDSLPLSVV